MNVAPRPPPTLVIIIPCFWFLNGMTFEGKMMKLRDKFHIKFAPPLWLISRYAPDREGWGGGQFLAGRLLFRQPKQRN